MLVFLCIAIVGLVFLLVAAVFGGESDVGGEHDIGGHEVGMDHAHEVSHDHEAAGPSPFSTRVIAMFLTTFGAAGAIGRYYGMGYMGSSGVGLGAGLITGFVAWQLIALFWRQQASSMISQDELVGLTAEVKTAIPESGIGQVSLVFKSQRLHYPARSKDSKTIEEGAIVKVVQCSGGSVIVERVQQ